jgi:hypothetical protein
MKTASRGWNQVAAAPRSWTNDSATLGVFFLLEVLEFDLFFGVLFLCLVLHVSFQWFVKKRPHRGIEPTVRLSLSLIDSDEGVRLCLPWHPSLASGL